MERSPRAVGTEQVDFVTADGVRIIGDLVVPSAPDATAIICHPHPLYGGDRFNHVVQALFDGFATAGIAALRFDFRAAFGGGVDEVADAEAALEFVAAVVPGAPVVAAGYSFGATVVLGVDDARVSARVLVAPPLAAMPGVAPARTAPTLVVVPAHDQFSDPVRTAAVVETWSPEQRAVTSTRSIEMADHSLAGRTHVVCEHAVAWLEAIRRPPPPSPPSPRR